MVNETKLAKLPVLLLDCQTTGASPRTGNLLEIAWMPENGKKGKLVSHLAEQPDNEPIPPRIESLTGIVNDDMENATSLKVIAKELKLQAKALSNEPVCVVHYARFETPFLIELFQNFGGRKTLPFDIVCTFEIARRLYPNLPSRGIRAIGGFLGLELDELKRARSHVGTTREIWKHLVEELAKKEVFTLEDLKVFLDTKAQGRSGKLEYPLDPQKRLSLPDKPGVYQFLNRKGKVLYVGKATSLKSRVNSHFRGRKRKTSRSFELLTQVVDIKVLECQSPLEAALIENDQIKKYDPVYNTSLKINERKLWFYSKDFLESSNTQSKKFPIGPFPHASIVDDVAELSRCLMDKKEFERSLYGITDSDIVNEAVDLFHERYSDALFLNFSVNNLLLLGVEIFRFQKRVFRMMKQEEMELDQEMLDYELDSGLEEDIDEEEPYEVEPDEEPVDLTAEDVLSRLESMLIGLARSYLRAKELTRMLELSLSYDYKGKNLKTIISDGNVVVNSGSSLERRRGGAYPWKKLDIVDYDRIRVLLTEICAMKSRSENIEVKPDIYLLSRW